VVLSALAVRRIIVVSIAALARRADSDRISGAVYFPSVATLRLADVLAGLSLIADLSVGSEPDQAMRTCGPAVSLAERAGMTKEEGDVYSEVESGDALERVLEAEPRPWRLASGAELDSVARAFGDVVDLKSPFFHGHSAGVAELAEVAAGAVGLGAEETSRYGGRRFSTMSAGPRSRPACGKSGRR
jgi:HD-GYP domain-containing protein (c-di-GMP phosphodiesterase class II)